MNKNLLALLILLSLVATLTTDYKTGELKSSNKPEQSQSEWAEQGLLQNGDVSVGGHPVSGLTGPGGPDRVMSPTLRAERVLSPDEPVEMSRSDAWIRISRVGDLRWTRHGRLEVEVRSDAIVLKVPLTRFLGDHIQNYVPSTYESDAVKLSNLKPGRYKVFLGDAFKGRLSVK